jgi:release factor glutamine methyltransferase
MTIQAALNVSKRSVSFRESEVLLAFAMEVERPYLHAHPEADLTLAQHTKYEKCLQRREDNEPVAYIVGCKEFYGRKFKVDSRALIPRPETEGIIDRAMTFATSAFQAQVATTNKPCPVRILELGTGCGNIAISMALELGERNVPYQILATDLAPEALALALENWSHLQVAGSPRYGSLKFVQSDLFAAPSVAAGAPFDLLLANLPYVPLTWRFDSQAQPEVIFQEPDIALFGGADGLQIYRRFFAEAPRFLGDTGISLIEYGEDQTASIVTLAESAFVGRPIGVYQDYAGLDRTLRVGPVSGKATEKS